MMMQYDKIKNANPSVFPLEQQVIFRIDKREEVNV